MTLPKKKSRIIRINDVNYRWVASGNDDYINLYIELSDNESQLLMAKFDYHHKEIEKDDRVITKQQFVVTPDIVRQTIEIAFKEGWNPTKKAKALDLGHIDEKINP